MNYVVHNMDSKRARSYTSRKFSFDYLEPDNFEREKELCNFTIIGYAKLREIDIDDANERLVIANGINDHYFKLKPVKEEQRLTRWNLIGYVQVSKYDYVAVYKRNILLPILMTAALLLAAILF